MKHIYICVMAMLCLNISSIQAQTDTATMPIYPHQSFTDAFDSLFTNTSKTYISTGALYNRVIPYACLTYGLGKTNSER